jgi:hypothetical protein
MTVNADIADREVTASARKPVRSRVRHAWNRRLRGTLPTARSRGTRRESTPSQAHPVVVAHVLGRYTEPSGRLREVVARAGAYGSVLVIDRDAPTLCDWRLVAHLAQDEPPGNAQRVCDQYMADRTRGCCRRVSADDLQALPMLETATPLDHGGPSGVVDGRGRRYCLGPVRMGRSVAELRWRTCASATTRAARDAADLLSLREVIGATEAYEPARAITIEALARYERDPEVSVCVLRGELQRMDASRIVLNRGLREAVLSAITTRDLTMNEISIRCGRMKRDGRGNVSGETSWLARRLGLAPEGGCRSPSPWIHSEVLALIARKGIGISPCDVELG